MKRYVVWLTGVLLLGCLGCAEEQFETESTTIPVRISPLVSRAISFPIHTSGLLSTKSNIRLSFKTGGYIEHMAAEEGDTVQEGEELAQLNLTEIKANVEKANNALEKAERDLNRVERLYKDNAVPLETKQDATTAYQVAEANLRIAEFNLKHSKIMAPMRGVILKRLAEPGELVGSGQPVFVLGSLESNWVVRCGVSAPEIVKVQKGDSATVQFDAYPGLLFSGHVSEVAESADSRTGTFNVEIAITADSHKLVSGFVGDVTIQPRQKERFHLIPVQALIGADSDSGFVFVIKDDSNTVTRIPVKTGPFFQDSVTITSGLTGVEAIVSEGAPYLTEGTQVRIQGME